MLVKLLICYFFLIISLTNAAKDVFYKKILIIRHGEQNQNGSSLPRKGFNRAIDLPEVIKNKFRVPKISFIPTIINNNNASKLRILQTATPIPTKYNITISNRNSDDKYKKISKQLDKTNGTILFI